MNATTKAVREFFSENPDLVPAGDKTVGPESAGRGRVSADAKRIFAEKNPDVTFVEGPAAKPVVTLTYKHTQPSGRKVNKTATVKASDLRAVVAFDGQPVPERGKLSAAHMERASANFPAWSEAQASAETESAQA